MSENAIGHGYLAAGPSRTAGKKIDEWTYVAPAGGKNLAITVHMLSNSGGLRFRATSRGLTEAIEDSDIEQLRKRVEQSLQDHNMAERGLVWEDWLEIVVAGYNRTHKDDIEVALTIKRNILQRAVMPGTGDAVVLRSNGGVPWISSFPKPKRAGEEDPVEGKGIAAGLGRRSVDAEYAYVPATPENLRAIEEIQDGLLRTRQRVSDFMYQAHQVGRVEYNGKTKLLSVKDE